MEFFLFLLGGAFGISISSLYLLIEQVRQSGITDELVIDILYECASIVFVFSLFNVYAQLR